MEESRPALTNYKGAMSRLTTSWRFGIISGILLELSKCMVHRSNQCLKQNICNHIQKNLSKFSGILASQCLNKCTALHNVFPPVTKHYNVGAAGFRCGFITLLSCGIQHNLRDLMTVGINDWIAGSSLKVVERDGRSDIPSLISVRLLMCL